MPEAKKTAEEKAFDQAFARKKAEVESDASRQRKRAMTPDEKRLRAVELQTEKLTRFYKENGVQHSEESIRRELAQRAERSERRKNGE